LNRARIHGVRPEKWWPFIRNDDLWPLQEHFNSILKETAEAAGNPIFIPPIE